MPTFLVKPRFIVAVVALAVIAAACGSSGYSTDPKAYMPAEVDGEEVTIEGTIVDEITQGFLSGSGFSGENVEVAAGIVGSGLIPKLALLAVNVAEEGSLTLQDLVDEIAGDNDTTTKDKIVVNGQDAILATIDTGGQQITLGMTVPANDIALISFGFPAADGADAKTTAEAGLKAMLAAGKT